MSEQNDHSSILILLNNKFMYVFLPFVLTGVVGTTSLAPEETLHIAMVAYKNLKFSLCISWIWETLRQLDLGADSLGSLTLLPQRVNSPLTLSLTQQHLSQGRGSEAPLHLVSFYHPEASFMT